MALPMTLERDMHELRERVAYLDGWKEGEAARYRRLESDVGGIKDELKTIHGRIDHLGESVNARIDRVLWFMIATLGAVLTNIAATILMK